MSSINWNNVLYTAVVLDDVSRKALKLYLESMIGEKTPSKVFCHHMTVAFGNKLSDETKAYIESNVGKKFTLNPIAYGTSDKAIAIMVETDAFSTNKIKHITLCTLNDGKPVDSNSISNWQNISDGKNTTLYGTMTCIER